jgi:hypothetical protein
MCQQCTINSPLLVCELCFCTVTFVGATTDIHPFSFPSRRIGSLLHGWCWTTRNKKCRPCCFIAYHQRHSAQCILQHKDPYLSLALVPPFLVTSQQIILSTLIETLSKCSFWRVTHTHVNTRTKTHTKNFNNRIERYLSRSIYTAWVFWMHFQTEKVMFARL